MLNNVKWGHRLTFLPEVVEDRLFVENIKQRKVRYNQSLPEIMWLMKRINGSVCE